MYEKLFTLYQDMGSVASARSEALSARASFVSGVMQQTYQLWLTLMTTEVTEAVKAAQELSACRTPAEVNDVQREWVAASFTRAITSLQGTVSIANLLIKELSTAMALVQVAQPINAAAASARAAVALPPPALPATTTPAPTTPAVVPVVKTAPVAVASVAAAPADGVPADGVPVAVAPAAVAPNRAESPGAGKPRPGSKPGSRHGKGRSPRDAG